MKLLKFSFQKLVFTQTCAYMYLHTSSTGGDYRVCLLEDEDHLSPGCMRPSGDCCYLDENGILYYEGRTDRQIKRLGHRINLDLLQEVIIIIF